MNWRLITVLLSLILVGVALSIVLNSEELDAEHQNQITVDANHGHIVDISDGTEYLGGPFSGQITLKFIAEKGYELSGWEVIGEAEYETHSSSITITSINGDITLAALVRNVSSSNNLLDTVNVPELVRPGDNLIMNWSFRSVDLSRVGGTWYGMPSTPLIVGESVYVRAAGTLYKLDVSTGNVENSVESVGDTVGFYHYLSYGNGVIFDTIAHRAYDLNLKYLYDLPTSLKFATYYDGYFYGCLQTSSGYQMFKTTVEVDSNLNNGVKTNIFTTQASYKLFGQYGQFSSFMIKNDWIFFLEANTSGSERRISAFNTITEEYRTVDLSTLIGGMYWDDGWLTFYQDYLYVTTYVGGLFGGVTDQFSSEHSKITWVKFNFETSTFGQPESVDIQTSDGTRFQGIASGFVIHNGRGYVNVRALGTDTTGGSNDIGTSLIAYDIGENGTPIPRQHAPSVMSHGGIILNTAYESDGYIYIYLIPYNSSSQGIYIFTDELKNGEWSLKENYDKLDTDPSRKEYCSQGIRVGPNGEIIYYLDTGNLDCYISPSNYAISVTLMSGNYAITGTATGSNAGKVILSLYPGSQLEDGQVIIGDKRYEIYGLNYGSLSWETISNPFLEICNSVTPDRGVISYYYRNIILLDVENSKHFYDAPESEQGWYYYYGGDYHKCILYDVDSFKRASNILIYSMSKPTGGEISLPLSISLTLGESKVLEVPLEYISSYDCANEFITVDITSGKMIITGKYVGNSQLNIFVDDTVNTIIVTILPKTYTDAAGNEVIDTTSYHADDEIVSIVTTHTKKGPVITTIDSEIQRYSIAGDEIDRTISTRTIDSQGDIDEFGQYITIDTIDEKGYVGTTLVRDTTYYEEMSTSKTLNGLITITKTSSLIDNFTGEKELKIVIQKTDSSYTSIYEKVDTFKTGSQIPDHTDENYEIIPKDNSMKISVVGDVLSLELNSQINVLDISALCDELIASNHYSKYKVLVIDSIRADVLVAITKCNPVLEMSSGQSSIRIQTDTLNNLCDKGDLVFGVKVAETISEKQKKAAGDAKVFSVNLKCGDVEQHDFGKFTLTIACDITLQDGKELKAWRIDDYGKKTYATNVTYSDGKVSFDADHLSIYAIGYESESSGSGDGKSDNGGGNGNTLMFAGIGAIAVLALLGAVFMMRRRH